MVSVWGRDFLTRRIDRCYLIAAGAKIPEKRKIHLELARHYRRMLCSISDRPSSSQLVWQELTPGKAHEPRVNS